MEEKGNVFGNFLVQKFVEEFAPWYLNKHGQLASDHDFAVFLGLSDQAYSQYKLGKRRPTLAVAERISDKLKDPHVYDLLGYPRRLPRGPEFSLLADGWPHLEEPERKEILDIIKRRLAEKEAKRQQKKNNATYA